MYANVGLVGEGRSSAVVPWISEQTPNVATCGAYCEIACETFPRANAESEATVVEDNLFPSRVSKRLYLDDCTSFSSSMLLVICLPIVFKLQKWTSTAVNMLTKIPWPSKGHIFSMVLTLSQDSRVGF